MAERPTVLVAGGAGFLGTHLTMRLLRDGVRVRATLHNHPPRVPLDDVEYVSADLTRAADCRYVAEGVERVFMCAAVTSGAAVMVKTPLAHVTPNVVMNSQMLEAAHHAGVEQFVYLGSGAAYPPTGARPVAEDEMFMGDPYPTYHAVGWMKRYTEILCETYARRLGRRMRTTIVRPSNVYGPWDKFDFATSHVTAALVRRVAERHRPIEVWGTGEDVRDLIYVDDFIEGLVRAAALPDDFLAINVASGKGYSVREILETLLAIDGRIDAKVRFDESKPSTIPVRLLDTGRARERLAFTPRTPLADGLARTLAWYRRQFLEEEDDRARVARRA